MQPNERRRRIIEILNLRRQDTMQNLANEFGVSRLTIYRDLLVLEESYPLRHIHGRAVYYLNTQHLTPIQAEAIRRNLDVVSPQDRAIFQSILNDFAWPV